MYSYSEIEKETIVEWKEKHLRERHRGKMPDGGAIGGSWSYIFTPTSIAVMVSVRCNRCHIEQDVTDLSQI